jgi:hypothetical protein
MMVYIQNVHMRGIIISSYSYILITNTEHNMFYLNIFLVKFYSLHYWKVIVNCNDRQHQYMVWLRQMSFRFKLLKYEYKSICR